MMRRVCSGAGQEAAFAVLVVALRLAAQGTAAAAAVPAAVVPTATAGQPVQPVQPVQAGGAPLVVWWSGWCAPRLPVQKLALWEEDR